MIHSHHHTPAAPTSRNLTESPHQFLTFMLGSEVFGTNILSIKEIIEYPNLTAVPMMPAYIRGVINLRGSVVPVIDLCVRFGKAANLATKRTCIIIIEITRQTQRHIVGIVVDAVNAVMDIPHAQIEPPPAYGTGIRTDFIQGMGKVNGKFVVLLNINHALAEDEMELLPVESTAPTADGAAVTLPG